VFSFTITILWLQGRVGTKEPYFTLTFSLRCGVTFYVSYK